MSTLSKIKSKLFPKRSVTKKDVALTTLAIAIFYAAVLIAKHLLT